MKKSTFIVGSLLILVLSFYAKTLSYTYVFDDVWRISKNPAVQRLYPISKYFTDPSTLSAFSNLNEHNYRPLLTLSFAICKKMFGSGAGSQRLFNLVFHGLNAGLVVIGGTIILGISPLAALVAGLIYAFHPIQVESTVWISERSNVLGLTFLLLGLLAWWQFLNRSKVRWAVATLTAFVVGLLIRENIIVFPIACLLLHRLKTGDREKVDPIFILPYVSMGIVATSYLYIRTRILKQFAQNGLWGSSLWSQLMAILENAGRTVGIIASPLKLSPYHDLVASISITTFGVIGLAAILAALFFIFYEKNARFSFCLSLMLFLWLPASNLIPIAVIFADRFAAPVLIPAVWMGGLLFDRLRRTLALSLAALILILLLFRTTTYLPAWRNEVSLWEYVLKEYPRSNFGWFCLGIAREQQIDWRGADRAYQKALEGKMLAKFAAQVFLHRARVALAEGRDQDANQLARQAIRMNSDLSAPWARVLENPKSTDGTMEFFFR